MGFSVITSTIASGTTTAVTTSALNTAGANIIIISVSWYNATIAVTDSKSNTWTPLTIKNNGNVTCRLYYCVNPTVGTGHTFSASAGGGAFYPVIGVMAFSGAATSQSPSEANNSGNLVTSRASGSVTPSQNGCLIISAISADGGFASPSINSGFTAISSAYASGTHEGGGIAYLIQTSAAAVNPTWSWTGNSNVSTVTAVFTPKSVTPYYYFNGRNHV